MQLITGTVDTQKINVTSIGSTNAGDDTLIELTIKSNGENLIFNNPSFELISKKTDNTRLRQLKGITLEDGLVKIKADVQLVLCKGKVTNQLIINDGDKISTVYFYFFVNPSLENEILEESKDKIESLDKLDQLINVSFDNLELYENKLLAFSIEMDSIVKVESKREANELIRSTSEEDRIANEDRRVISEEDRIANEAIRVENEEARGLAESERVINENNRRLAENTRKTQENARVAAESERQAIFEENENIRKEQEGKRVQAESVRKNKFNTWEEREGLRLISEDQRREAEESRQLAESNRDKAEKVREQQEANREATYNNFNNAEEERVNNESSRKDKENLRALAENSRVAAEKERVAAENTRNSRYETAESNRNNTFNSNENKRQSDYESNEGTRNSTFEAEERKRKNSYQDAENTRNNSFNQQEENRQNAYTAAERLRVENENLRKNNEATRGSNEETRKTNETSRVSAENIRVENEKTRVAAEEERQANFEKIKTDNTTFKEEVKTQYDDIVTENNNFKNQMNTDFGNAKTDYFGEDHINVVDRLNSDFDNVHQRINDSSYLDYEGSNIKADNSYYGLTKDLSIKGRTLQNLFVFNKINSPYGVIIKKDNSYSYTPNTIHQASRLQFEDGILMKSNTIYTVVMEIKLNNYTVVEGFAPRIVMSNGVADSTAYITVVGGQNNIIKVKCSTPDILDKLYFRIYFPNAPRDEEILVSNIMILEGDYTDTPISQLPFDEGIYSVGESENNLINVKSIGKNLFDNTKVNIPYFNANSSGLTFSIKDNKIYVNGICTKMIDFRIFSESHYTELTKYINSLPDGTTICLSNNLGLQNYFSSKSKSTGKYSYNANSLTKSSDVIEITSFVRFNEGATFNNSELKVQVELDNTSTHFPYEENNQSYQITAPLRSLPNGVCDEIIGDDLIRRIGELNLNDIIDWNIVSTLENTINFVWSSKYNNVYKAVQSSFSLCNKVPYLRNSNEDKYHCRFNGSTPYSAFMIWIEKNKLSTQDTNGLIQWLQENPTTVYYELTEPIVTKLPKKAELKSFDGTTHFTSNNKLLPSLSVKVPSNVQAVLQDTRARNRELEIELETTTLKLKEADNILKEMDTDLIKTNWEMDDRLFEVEWALEDAGLVTSVSTFNINNKMRGSASVMALSKFEQAKIIIMSGDYDRATLEGQLSKYLKRNIIAQDEYDTLISMMDAKEIVVGE